MTDGHAKGICILAAIFATGAGLYAGSFGMGLMAFVGALVVMCVLS